jgi:PD-(D/E)XK endonuclease
MGNIKSKSWRVYLFQSDIIQTYRLAKPRPWGSRFLLAASGHNQRFPGNHYMTNRGINIKNRKQRGEWAEMCFMARAATHGLCVAKPYGDSARFDFAIEHHGHFLRVQVKSTKYMLRLLYLPCGLNPTLSRRPDRLRRRLRNSGRRLVHPARLRIPR